jgi:Asp-tRNA(Asn)/Glu-tRNA(Gln) amidotransferase A subunit family amidase
MEKAKKCDKERAEAKKPLSFIHGIPISIKEQFDMRGRTSTIGCAMLHHKREKDSECFRALVEAGAIPLVRGNLP